MLHTISTSEIWLKTGREKNQYLLTAVTGLSVTVLWDPKPTNSQRLCSPQSSTYHFPAPGQNFTKSVIIRLASKGTLLKSQPVDRFKKDRDHLKNKNQMCSEEPTVRCIPLFLCDTICKMRLACTLVKTALLKEFK